MANEKGFNLDLLFLTKENIRGIGKITDLSIFEASTNNFNPEGLFSTEIFGRVGSADRNVRYGYVDLQVEVFHPLIYKHISSLKKLYDNILQSKVYAKFDNKIKDFVAANADEGDTGFSFFLEHFHKIKLEDNDSDGRLFKIKTIKKYMKTGLMIDKLLVLPAGLRDYKVDDSGKPSEDEVNDLYRRLITSTNSLKNINTAINDKKMLDPIRAKIQLNVVNLYDHFIALMDGKKKFIQGKWSKRAIRDSTRNVITPTIANITDLTNKKHNISTINTVIGLYQYSKAINPIAKYKINTTVLMHIFDTHSNTANLIDKKKLETVTVEVSPKTKDQWMSDEGLSGVINKLSQEELRSEPIVVEGKYLALVYDDGKNIRLVVNTGFMPDDRDKKYLRPITYAEMVYLCIYNETHKYPAFLTRYPVANVGSIYATVPYLKTTVKGRKVNILNASWEVEDEVVEFPKNDENYYNSLSPAVKNLGRLDGD